MKITISDVTGYPAQYEHSSMYGTYVIDCEIIGWDDKSGQFLIKYLNPFHNEVEQDYTSYARVTGWTWPTLREYFFGD